jgi:acylphosphatase
MKTTKLEISGRVQGVFFRANTKEFADKINLKGQVKNQDNGSVLIITQGTEKQLEKLIAWINSNPGMSKVEKIEKEEYKTKEIYKDFQIIREYPLLEDKKKALKNLFGKRSQNLSRQ